MPWFALTIAALAVIACQSTGTPKKCNCNFEIPRGYGQSVAAQGAQALLTMRVDSHEHRLSKASIEIHTLQKKAYTMLGSRENLAKRIRQIRKRIKHLEGSHCEDKDHFACGDGSDRCISTLLVCDKVNDCNNGADEEKNLCAEPEIGTKWEAYLKAEDAGCARRIIKKFSVTIRKVISNKYLVGRPQIEASFLATSVTKGRHIQEFFVVTGSWDPAHQELIFSPPEKHDPLGIICRFDGVDHSHCEAAFYNVHSHKECGFFTFTKIKSD